MNRVAQFGALCAAAISNFIDRCEDNVEVFSEPTESIMHRVKRDGARSVFGATGRLADGQGAKARLEENYLFDTRLLPTTIAAGELLWFTSAMGQSGSNNGFAAALVMSDVETNMEIPSQISKAKDYVLTQIGISFGAGTTAANAAVIMEMGALRFNKGPMILRHGPGIFWPGGMGVVTALATNATGQSGFQDIRAVRKLAVPRVIQSGETFNYSYGIPRAVSSIDNSTALTLSAASLMRIWLWGGQRDAIKP